MCIPEADLAVTRVMSFFCLDTCTCILLAANPVQYALDIRCSVPQSFSTEDSNICFTQPSEGGESSKAYIQIQGR